MDSKPDQASDTTQAPSNSTPTTSDDEAAQRFFDTVRRKRAELGLPIDGTPRERPDPFVEVGKRILSHADNSDRAEAEQRERQVDRDNRLKHDRWRALLDGCGNRYADCRLENFETYDPAQSVVLAKLSEYADNVVENIQDGRSVILFGPPGTGKDHLLIGLARMAICAGSFLVRWVNGLDLYGEMRDRMSADRSEEEKVRELSGCNVLILSDPLPPAGDLTSFQSSMVLRIIDRRYRNCQPTWLTMNVADGREAGDRMGHAAIDRLRHDGLRLHCQWPSYRGRAR